MIFTIRQKYKEGMGDLVSGCFRSVVVMDFGNEEEADKWCETTSEKR